MAVRVPSIAGRWSRSSERKALRSVSRSASSLGLGLGFASGAGTGAAFAFGTGAGTGEVSVRPMMVRTVQNERSIVLS